MPRIVVSFSKYEKAETYKTALRGVGGPGVEIVDAFSGAPASTSWPELLGDADGLLLTGGLDVEPERYGESRHADAGLETLPARDAMEWSLLEAARRDRVPVLAICRGHQVAHAFLGGSLWQDLGEIGPQVRSEHDLRREDRRALAHGIEVLPGSSPLHRLLADAGALAVNSLHHQAVKRPGAGMAVLATAPDGVIEASAMGDDSWWLWSVQWHPEELVGPRDHPLHRELFERFLDAATAAGSERASRVRTVAR